MKVFSAEDMIKIIEGIQHENLDVSIGKGDEKRIIIKPGLKIRHKESKLVYTVIAILSNDGESNFKILCFRPGKRILIPSEEFKDYERH
jgi:hypothetical protein